MFWTDGYLLYTLVTSANRWQKTLRRKCLGSIVGLALGLLGIITIVARIFDEETMLLHELIGYEAYMKKVKYRLLPFIW